MSYKRYILLGALFLVSTSLVHPMEGPSEPPKKRTGNQKKRRTKPAKALLYAARGADRELLNAAKRGDTDSVRRLLDGGANIFAVNTKESRKQALHFAAEAGHTETVRLLLERGAQVDNSALRKELAIHFAAGYGHLETVRLLLEKGATINSKLYRCKTQSIHMAAEQGHRDIVELLLDWDTSIVNATDNNGEQPIHFAVYKGHTAIVELLLERGATGIDTHNSEGMQPLHWAARNSNIAIVELLLERGAHVDATTTDGWQPIHFAASNHHTATVKLLLERGAKVDATTNSGMQPIHSAASNRHTTAIIKLLLERGAKVDATTEDGRQPIHFADFAAPAIVKLLLDRGACINTPDIAGNLPIHYAVRRSDYSAVQILLSNGADVNAANVQGESPLKVALKHDNHCSYLKNEMLRYNRVISLLMFCGARVVEKKDQLSLTAHGSFTIDTKQNGKKALRAASRLEPSVMLRVASGQDRENMVQSILNNFPNHLTANDYSAALVGASTAGHMRVVSLLSDHMSKDEILKKQLKTTLKHALRRCAAHRRSGLLAMLIEQFGDQFNVIDYARALFAAATGGHLEVIRMLHQQIPDGFEHLPATLARALIRAASHRRFNVIDYLIDARNEIITPIAPAGRILQNILRPFSDEQIAADPRLQDYHTIFHMLSDTQRFLIARRDHRLLDYMTELDVASHDDESLP